MFHAFTCPQQPIHHPCEPVDRLYLTGSSGFHVSSLGMYYWHYNFNMHWCQRINAGSCLNADIFDTWYLPIHCLIFVMDSGSLLIPSPTNVICLTVLAITWADHVRLFHLVNWSLPMYNTKTKHAYRYVSSIYHAQEIWIPLPLDMEKNVANQQRFTQTLHFQFWSIRVQRVSSKRLRRKFCLTVSLDPS